MDNKVFQKRIIIISTAIAALSLATLATVYFSKKSISDIPIYDKTPSFSALNQDSIIIQSDKFFRGKITIFNFLFTSCPSICIHTTARIVELNKFYKNHLDQIQFVSLTVDPKNDKPHILLKYKKKHAGNIPNNWTLLFEANIEKIKHLSEKGFLLPAGDLPGEHSGKFVLIDKKGNIRGFYGYSDDGSMRALKSHVRELAFLE